MRAQARLARHPVSSVVRRECTPLHTQANLRLLAHSDYIQIRSPVYLPHSAGRYAAKRFRKANCPIIERLTNSLMMHGRNNGKKLMAVRIVAHAFEIVRPPTTSCRRRNLGRFRMTQDTNSHGRST